MGGEGLGDGGGRRGGRGRGGEAYSVTVCLSSLNIDHASLSRRSTVPSPNDRGWG